MQKPAPALRTVRAVMTRVCRDLDPGIRRSLRQGRIPGVRTFDDGRVDIIGTGSDLAPVIVEGDETVSAEPAASAEVHAIVVFVFLCSGCALDLHGGDRAAK